MSIKEVKAEANRQEESCRRLRALLSQARALLKDAGVPFMDDSSDLELDGKKKGRENLCPLTANTMSNVCFVHTLRYPSRAPVQSFG